MRILDNCLSKTIRCPFLQYPMFHSGFTGKSGPETWWYCLHHQKYMRHIKKCSMMQNSELQRNTWRELQAEISRGR